MADTIFLDSAKLGEKILELSKIKFCLESDVNVLSLPFGANDMPESCGSSSENMHLVNQEFEMCTKKFLSLIQATINYLEKVKNTFVEADTQMAGGV